MRNTKLFYSEKHPIGLDISQTGIKVMAIDPKKWLVQGYGSIDLDPTAMQSALEGDENSEDTYLQGNIEQLLSDGISGVLPSNHCVIGVPTGKSYSRTFSLPPDQIRSVADAVEIEVSQYIPIPLAALYVDYKIIEKNKDSVIVTVSAVPRTIIDNCLKAARGAGLRPVMVEPGINAIARLLESTEDAHMPTLIIDIGQATTDIAVLSKGTVRVSGSVSVGGNTFTLDIAKRLNVALDNAHQLKVINGLSAGPRQSKLTNALRHSLSRISTDAKKVLRYYSERITDAEKIEQVLIVGAGSNMPGIGEHYTNELIMPVRVASPWQRLDFGKLKEPGKQFRPRYITVAGLASVNESELWK